MDSPLVRFMTQIIDRSRTGSRMVSFTPARAWPVHNFFVTPLTCATLPLTSFPILNMNQFLTVKEAMKLVEKSESTIKRLLREITTDADHADRGLIQPSHEDVEERRAAGEPYIWKIARELLERRYPQHAAKEKGTGEKETEAPSAAAGDAIVNVLREQLQSKDRQIETLQKQLDKKDDQISNQNERMRETNILMKDLQQRLSISAPAAPTNIVVDQDSQKGTATPTETVTVEPKRKTSFWKREFRLFGRS